MRFLQLCCACQGCSSAFLSYMGRRNSRGKGKKKKRKIERTIGTGGKIEKKKERIVMVGKIEKERKGN